MSAGNNTEKTRLIVVTGGVCSSIGKGVLAGSIAVMLKHAGYNITLLKCDPYLNVDPGTMSPLVHGEVFVTADGAETDMDLGHYERMLDMQLTRQSSISSGQIFYEIIQKEREGAYLGRCIQLVPHAVDAIKQRIFDLIESGNYDFVIVEIGGTVGDMEGEIFLETVRHLRMEMGNNRVILCHLSYLPYLSWANEVKTKPTQHSVMQLKKFGLIPDALFLRVDNDITPGSRAKLAVMCGVMPEHIFQVKTHDPIFRLFCDLDAQGVPACIQQLAGITPIRSAQLEAWNTLSHSVKKNAVLHVGLIVKYEGMSEPYASVVAALKSAGYVAGYHIEVIEISAEALEENDAAMWETLRSVQGIVMPGGFDKRGIAGKIAAARYARENEIPYLGLCLGLQIMLIEFARSVLGYAQADSTEFNPETPHPVVLMLPEQLGIFHKGASMRLGSYDCSLLAGSMAQRAYGMAKVSERHRHRYEFNNKYKQNFESAGMVFSGINEGNQLVEIAELQHHPYMIGAQFHPEFQSSYLRPHPLFCAFIQKIMKISMITDKSLTVSKISSTISQ